MDERVKWEAHDRLAQLMHKAILQAQNVFNNAQIHVQYAMFDKMAIESNSGCWQHWQPQLYAASNEESNDDSDAQSQHGNNV